jgi:hypothetical protein
MPVVDVVHSFHGLQTPGGVCRIRVYRPAGFPPVVIASELPENENPSVTNIVEELAVDVLTRYLPDRVGAARPFVWVEHYPPRRVGARDETWDLVTFPDYTPKQVLEAGRWRERFGEPEWRRLTRGQVEALIGEDLPAGEDRSPE